MGCMCSILGCKNRATRVTMFDAHTPSSVFCTKHFEQMKALVKGHRDRGWIDNDEPINVRLYNKKDESGKMVVIEFPTKIFYADV